MGQVNLRLSDEMHQKAKDRAKQRGQSLNAYLTQLLQHDLGLQSNKEPEKKADTILRELQSFIAKHGRAMTFTEAQLKFHLTYAQLWQKYKPFLLADRKRAQAETQAKEMEERWGKDEKNEGEGTSLNSFWS